MTNPTRWWSNEAGATLRAAIEARGLTVAEFAQQLDVSPGRAHAWLGGRSAPGGDRLQRVADALGLVVARDLPAPPAANRAHSTPVGAPTGLDCGPADTRAARLAEFAARWATRHGPDA